MAQTPAERQRLYRERHPERVNAWKRNNPDRVLANERARYKRNKEEITAYKKQWLKDNPGKTTEYCYRWQDKNPNYMRDYYVRNKEAYLASARKNNGIRMATDPVYKIKKNLRRRVNTALHRGMAGRQFSVTKELLGCSIGRFMEYLHAHFKPGMSFNNYGKWHADHRKPISAFDLTDPLQQKECFHFTNLQPLWATDNLRKSDKLSYTVA